MEWVVSIIALYAIIGFYYGWNHANKIIKKIEVAGQEEMYLREMVTMYELTPQGAEYYIRLQELIIREKEWIYEYHKYKKNKHIYKYRHWLIGVLFWPYILFLVETK